MESEIDRVTEAMVAALSASSRAISQDDFKTAASYNASKLKLPLPVAQRRIKDIAERLKITPERRGLLWSARWFRTIR